MAFRHINASGIRSAPRSFGRFTAAGDQCAFGDTGSSSKTYRIDIPVFAGPPGTTQEQWNAVASDFTCMINGELKKFSVNMNLANTANGVQVYPVPGSSKGVDTYFPPNTWAFAISPRNLKQFNYQMLMDGLIWTQYSVKTVDINWTPCLGSLKSGQIEVILVNDAQSMPAEPYSNQGNSVVFPAAASSIAPVSRSFNVVNLQQPIKKFRSVETTWSANADFGILWVRADSYTDLTTITKVGSISIAIGVTLFDYSPDPKAQLIGPWIEAGYPIEGAVQTTGDHAKTNSSAFVIPEATDALDWNKLNARRRKATPKGWHLITEQGHDAMPLGGFHGAISSERARAHAKRENLKRGINDTDENLFNAATTAFDFGVDGRTLFEGIQVSGGSIMRIDHMNENGEEFKGSSPAIAQPANTQLVFKPGQTVNAHALATGAVSTSFAATEGASNYVPVGKKVGFTITNIAGFQATAKPPAMGVTANQLAFGYAAGIGNAMVKNIDGNGLIDFIKKAVVKTAGVIKSLQNSNELGAENENIDGNSALAIGAEAEIKKVADIETQTLKFVVPEDATVRSTIAKWDETSSNAALAKLYFKDFDGLAAYGLKTFDPSKMAKDVARLSINGFNAAAVSALCTLTGTASGLANAELETSTVFVLAASRYDPADDMDKFIKTCVPITPLGDSATQGHAAIEMANLSGDTQLSFKIQETTTALANGKQVELRNYSPVAGIGYLQAGLPCAVNFTVPFPDKLIKADDDDSMELTELKVGEAFYCMVIKAVRASFSHTVTETAGTFTFSVYPDIMPGLDKAEAGQALHQYKLTKNDNGVVTAVAEGDELNESIYYLIEAERRFALQSSAPVDSQ